MEDLLIRGGQVIDGTGTPARRADVAIKNGRITAVGDCKGRQAQREIDASGQIVAPGFIDIHTHSDFTLPLNPLAESKIRQGVTTEVVGNCGYSTAPVLPGKARYPIGRIFEVEFPLPPNRRKRSRRTGGPALQNPNRNKAAAKRPFSGKRYTSPEAAKTAGQLSLF